MVCGLWFVFCGLRFIGGLVLGAPETETCNLLKQSLFLYLSWAKNAIGILIFQAASLYSAALIFKQAWKTSGKTP
jgi:hypothetical protein